MFYINVDLSEYFEEKFTQSLKKWWKNCFPAPRKSLQKLTSYLNGDFLEHFEEKSIQKFEDTTDTPNKLNWNGPWIEMVD